MSQNARPFSGPSSPPGFSFRHLATVLLLMVTVPVFACGALLTLPLMLVAGALEALHKFLMVEPRSRDAAPY